ncbi:MAG: polysaccharide deacetylase family protein [Anaerolineales bacterium]|nr:polysaccharide deacetylase family protein [Anaerolineales bacterium]MDO9348536.1 polysaccharide deacetylase family protein [Anaerolineales bacterium]MDP3183942.1 polysaccharide deacetylase family protein [Anaerolineales bacterium]
MHPNPILNKLGFSNTDRLVIIHTDDIGMCHASIQAYADLWDFGAISSGAVMVPCPWFPAAAELCRTHPETDMGVHLTLTSEWQFYRWGPVSIRGADSGLMDAEGYFPRADAEVQESADPDRAALELEAQVRRALDFGIDVSHIDTHMAAIAHPKFTPAYIQLAHKFRLPPLIPRLDAAGFEKLDFDSETAAFLASMIGQLEEQGLPLVDNATGLPLDQPDGQLALAKKMLAELPTGLTHFIIHPSIDTPELRAITPDWPSRVANYQTFISQEIKDFLKNAGIHVIGYKSLRALMRN